MLIPPVPEGLYYMMRTPIRLIALSVTCLLASCVTAYQPDGISGGYSDKVLAGNTVQVTFRGNRLTTPETVHSFLLRRCAEVTLQDGYNYFGVIREETPNEGTTDNFGSKVGTATIQMYQGKPQGDAHVYDASLLLRKLLADEGESEEPQAADLAGSGAMPPPIPGAGIPSNNVAAASSLPLANPNALSNQPVLFEHW
jgi:hypothetical protein